MDFAKLKLFVEVAEHGSLTKASIALSSVPSAISRKIAAFEQECGGRLFHRTGRGVTLTELGERILPRARELLNGLDHLSDDIRANAGVPMGEVRVGLLASLAHPVINQLFRHVRANYPSIKLHVFGGSNGQLDEWLASGHIDMALLFRYGRAEVGNEQSLGVVDTYLIGAKGDPITREPTVNFSQIDRLPLILPGAPNGLRVILDQLAKKKGVTLSVVMEANALPIQKDVVVKGDVHTVLAGYAAAREVELGLLQASRIVNPGIERIITLGLTSHKPATIASLEVARILREIIDGMSGAMNLRKTQRLAAAPSGEK